MSFPNLTQVPDAELVDALNRADWTRFDPAVHGRRLRDRIARAPAAARRVATGQLGQIVPLAVPRLQHHGINGLGVDADRRLLAVGGDCGGSDDGSSVSVWDLDVGRIVTHIDGIEGSVGWSGHRLAVQWRPDGTVALSFSTNIVGVFDPFTGGQLDQWDLTEGWDEPPAFAVSASGTIAISCWGPDRAVIALVDVGVAPRWIAEVPDDLQPPNVEWAAAGLFGNSGEHRLIVDPASGSIVARWPGAAAAWSPSGRRVVVGATVRDARTDRVLFPLPGGMAENVAFAGDERVLARYDDRVDLVHIARTVRIPVIARRYSWQIPDLSPIVVSPNGDRVALLGTNGRVHLHRIDGTAVGEFPAPGAIGLLWAREDRIVAGSSSAAAILTDRGEPVGGGSAVFPAGWAAPARLAAPVPVVSRVTRRGMVDLGVAPHGVHGHPDDIAVLQSELALRVGACAWPMAWGDPVPALQPLPPRPRPTGDPFYAVYASGTDPRDAFLRKLLIEQGIASVSLQSWPLAEYHVPQPLIAPFGLQALEALVGRVVMWADEWRLEYVQIGGLVRGKSEVMLYQGSRGSSGGGPLAMKSLAWIGAAVPRP